MTGDTALLISDIHTNYEVINAQIAHAEETCGHPVVEVLVLGDFGFFGDQLHRFFRRADERFLRPVTFIEGNHEDHEALADLVGRYADVVTHLPRGTLHRLGPWRGVCLGGARYMDASSTPRGCEITSEDVDACLRHPVDAVDMVLSHDCPADIGVPNAPGLEHYGAPGVPLMARLARHYRPRWWFFGHHHRWSDLTRDGTRYVGLPQSWTGYVLLHADGEIAKVSHEVPIDSRPWWTWWTWWKRLLGLR
jgi:hypothetical protein